MSGCHLNEAGYQPSEQDGKVWSPQTWTDVLLPLARYLLQVLQRFREAPAKAATRKLFEASRRASVELVGAEPTATGRQLLERELEYAARIIEHARVWWWLCGG